jgi:hypothetical protein
MKIGNTEHDSTLKQIPRCPWLHRLWLDRIGIAALVTAIGFAFPEMVGATPAAPELAVTVRVYNYAQPSSTLLAEAEHEAGRIFAEAGLKTVWLDCMPAHSGLLPQAPCQDAIEATDIRLRILTLPVRNSLQDTALGFAVAPVLATVYYESVLALAKYDDREFEGSIVLGCAIAHEIGHLLLGSNRHSLTGVMRAQWERKQIRQALMGAMLFTPDQARLMQAETQKRMTLMKETHRPSRIPLPLRHKF